MAETAAQHKARYTEEVADKVETLKALAERNPVGTLARRFDELYTRRIQFVDEAKKMAELVVPGMYEGTPVDPYSTSSDLFGLPEFVSPNQSLIPKGVLLLSWTMANVVLPSDGDYFARSIEESVAQQMLALEELRKQQNQMMGQPDPTDFVPINVQINNEFLRDDIIVRKQTAGSNHQEVLARCFYHSLISGFSVFAHISLTEAKCYTIQNSVAVFDSTHEAVETIVVDRVPLTKFPESVRKKVLTKLKGEDLIVLHPKDLFVTVYTQQVRIDEQTLQVNTEINGVIIDELSFEIPAEAPVLDPVPFMFANESDPHPIGWLTYNSGEVNEFENICLSCSSMVAAAMLCLVGIPAGMNITDEELRNKFGLASVALKDDKSKLDIITAPIAQNLAQVMALRDKMERSLMMIFGMDFAIQRSGERVTKEEIQVLSNGLQKLHGATYKQYERAWQHKHVRRQFFLAEEAGMIRPVDKKMYTMSLTAGLQQQEAQNEVGKYDQWEARVGRLAQFSGRPVTNINPNTTANWLAQKLKLDVSDKLMTPEQEAEQLGVRQFLDLARQLGPQAPGAIAQMMTSMMQGGGATVDSNAAPAVEGV